MYGTLWFALALVAASESVVLTVGAVMPRLIPGQDHLLVWELNNNQLLVASLAFGLAMPCIARLESLRPLTIGKALGKTFCGMLLYAGIMLTVSPVVAVASEFLQKGIMAELAFMNAFVSLIGVLNTKVAWDNLVEEGRFYLLNT